MMRKYERDKEISLNPAKKKSLLWFEFSSCKKCLTGNRINIRRYLFQISTESFSESILFIGRKTANGFRQFIHLPFRRFGYNVREERVGGDIQGICDGDEVIKVFKPRSMTLICVVLRSTMAARFSCVRFFASRASLIRSPTAFRSICKPSFGTILSSKGIILIELNNIQNLRNNV